MTASKEQEAWKEGEAWGEDESVPMELRVGCWRKSLICLHYFFMITSLVGGVLTIISIAMLH